MNKWLDPSVYCGHGKKYKGEDCPECDKIWNEECLERAYKNVVHYSDRLSIPYAEIARNYKAAPIIDAAASPPNAESVGEKP